MKKPSNSAVKAKKKIPVKPILFALIGILLFLIFADLIAAFVQINRWIYPEKQTWTASPAEYGLDYYSFELETPNGTVSGWKIAAQTPISDDADDWVYTDTYSDKTVIIASNYDSNRENTDVGGLDYVADLCDGGYNVFLFDWTGSGYSDGKTNVFTADKTEELRTVVEYVKSETESKFLAVQAVGFSCLPVARVAAECDEIDALIFDSCYGTLTDVLFDNYGEWGDVNLAPVRATVRKLLPLLSDTDLESASMLTEIQKIGGKSIFFIQGENDELFGSDTAETLKSVANEKNTVQLWSVANASHLRANSIDPETYSARTVNFLNDAYKTAVGENT